jgi:hypothetical protein
MCYTVDAHGLVTMQKTPRAALRVVDVKLGVFCTKKRPDRSDWNSLVGVLQYLISRIRCPTTNTLKCYRCTRFTCFFNEAFAKTAIDLVFVSHRLILHNGTDITLCFSRQTIVVIRAMVLCPHKPLAACVVARQSLGIAAIGAFVPAHMLCRCT